MAEAISLELLKQILHYEPETGVWTNRVRRGKLLAGSIAGRPDSEGYTILVISRKHYRSARLAWFYMTGVWPVLKVDHKDTVRKNDRWDNLRLATNAQNLANRPAQSNNSLGVKGVYFRASCPNFPYAAHIRVGGVGRLIGSFSTIEEARAAYLRAANEAFGEFARGA